MPTIVLGRIEHFSAAHRLHSAHLTDSENVAVYGKCNSLHGHGHNYRVEVRLRGTIDERTGMVANLEDVKRETERVLEMVDHKNLDTDVEWFASRVRFELPFIMHTRVVRWKTWRPSLQCS